MLIIGGRFGGAAVDAASAMVPLKDVEDLLPKADPKRPISITQLEVLAALRAGLAIFTFVSKPVMADHLRFTKHRSAGGPSPTYRSIKKPETAEYIFDFIDFVRRQPRNNGFFEVTSAAEIAEHLRRQWSMLFQRICREHRRLNPHRQLDPVASEALDHQITRLSDALSAAGVDFAFGGSLAASFYGNGRSTVDLDVYLFVEPTDDNVSTILRVLGGIQVDVPFDDAMQRAIRDCQVRLNWMGATLDVFFSCTDFHQNCSSNTRAGFLTGGREIRLLGPDDLIVFAMFLSRSKDAQVVRRLLQFEPSVDRPGVLATLAALFGDDDERVTEFAGMAGL